MSSPKFLIFRSTHAADYYFELHSQRGEVILSGQSQTKQNCLKVIATVKKNALYESRFERLDNAVTYSFNLKSATWAVVAKSPDYTSATLRELGILEVKRDAPKALIIEKS